MKNNAITNILNNINTRKFTNKTQKAAYRLLRAKGGWVSNRDLMRTISNTRRVRDLRLEQFGAFQVECASATDLNKKGENLYFYRIKPSSVKKAQLSTIFDI